MMRNTRITTQTTHTTRTVRKERKIPPSHGHNRMPTAADQTPSVLYPPTAVGCPLNEAQFIFPVPKRSQKMDACRRPCVQHTKTRRKTRTHTNTYRRKTKKVRKTKDDALSPPSPPGKINWLPIELGTHLLTSMKAVVLCVIVIQAEPGVVHFACHSPFAGCGECTMHMWTKVLSVKHISNHPHRRAHTRMKLAYV